MSDIKAKLKQIRRPSTTVDVCLRGDLADQYEQLERDLADLPKSAKLSGDPERERITDSMERIRAEMADSTVTFKMHALPDAKFQALVDEHPPRRRGDDVDERDANMGFDRSTFYPALIRACTVEPTLDDEDWELIFGEDGITAGQKVALNTAALGINSRQVDVPFSPAGSGPNQD